MKRLNSIGFSSNYFNAEVAKWATDRAMVQFFICALWRVYTLIIIRPTTQKTNGKWMQINVT